MKMQEEVMREKLLRAGLTEEELNSGTEMLEKVVRMKIHNDIIPEIIITVPQSRYVSRDDFVDCLADCMMCELVTINSMLTSNDNEDCVFVNNNFPSTVISNAIMLCSYCTRKYGDTRDIKNWRSMIDDMIVPETELRRSTLSLSLINTICDNYKPFLFGIVTGLFVAFNLWCKYGR